MKFVSKSSRAGFVLSGGASLGAIEVGMLIALGASGVNPSIVGGASVGALNATFIATREWPESLVGLGKLWLSLKRQDVFPLDIPNLVSAVLGRKNNLISNAGLKKIIEDNLAVATFDEANIPLRVIGTSLKDGSATVFKTGELAPRLLASTSIPGIFPPVEIDGEYFIDGGVANNVPVDAILDLGIKKVFVLSPSYGCESSSVPNHPLSMLVHSFELVNNRRVTELINRYEKRYELVVLKSICPNDVSGYDFSQTARLITDQTWLSLDQLEQLGYRPDREWATGVLRALGLIKEL